MNSMDSGEIYCSALDSVSSEIDTFTAESLFGVKLPDYFIYYLFYILLFNAVTFQTLNATQLLTTFWVHTLNAMYIIHALHLLSLSVSIVLS